jgi:hypothetical protein
MKTNFFRKINLPLLGRGLGGGLLLLTALPATAQDIDLRVCPDAAFALVSVEDAGGPSELGAITYTWVEITAWTASTGFEEISSTLTVGPSAFLTISEGRPTGLYQYVRNARNAACELSSNTYTVEVVGFFQPPKSTYACPGGTATVDASTTAEVLGGVVTYQWKKNGEDVSIGGTDAYLVVSPAGNGYGTYSVEAYIIEGNAACTVVSNEFTVAEAILPAGAASTSCLPTERGLWSDRIIVPAPACTQGLPQSAAAYYTVHDGHYMYTPACVAASAESLCPAGDGWRLPSFTDFFHLCNYANSLNDKLSWWGPSFTCSSSSCGQANAVWLSGGYDPNATATQQHTMGFVNADGCSATFLTGALLSQAYEYRCVIPL